MNYQMTKLMIEVAVAAVALIGIAFAVRDWLREVQRNSSE